MAFNAARNSGGLRTCWHDAPSALMAQSWTQGILRPDTYIWCVVALNIAQSYATNFTHVVRQLFIRPVPVTGELKA